MTFASLPGVSPYRSFLRMVMTSLAFVAVIAPALTAQTAHFSYARRMMGGTFVQPVGIALDKSGNAYVADAAGNAVMEIPSGCASSSCVTTLGGGFASPTGVAVDASKNVYVADGGHAAVKKFPAGCASSSCVTTLGGGFSHPSGVTVDSKGNVYVADSGGNAVKEIPAGCASSSCVTTLGGGFSAPTGIARDTGGNVYIGDTGNNAVKKVPPGCVSSSCVTTLGGGFSKPQGLAAAAGGTIYVSDAGNNAVKEIPAGCLSSACVVTVGGGFSSPEGVSVDGNGNVFVADTGHGVAKEIMFSGVNFFSTAVGSAAETVVLKFAFDTGGTIQAPLVMTQGAAGLDFGDAGTGTCTTNGASHAYKAGDTCTMEVTFAPHYPGARYGGVALTNASGTAIATAYLYGVGIAPQVAFNPSILDFQDFWPGGVAVDGGGNIYMTFQDGTVQEMPAGCSSYTCAKTLGGGFSWPLGVAVDGGGNVYVSDIEKNAVYRMPPGCLSSACVSEMGGDFSSPHAVAVDGDGKVYVADSGNAAAKEMAPGCASAACVKTIGGYTDWSVGIAVDISGNVYLAEAGSTDAVKKIPAGCSSADCMSVVFDGEFFYPQAMALDGVGNLYVAGFGGAVVEITPGCTSSSCGTTLTPDDFEDAYGLAVDGSGNVYVAGDAYLAEIDRHSQPSLTFAPTEAGTVSPDSPNWVGIWNIGNASLTFAVPGSGYNPSVAQGFKLDSSTYCPHLGALSKAGSLAAGASCYYAVDFVPQKAGSYSGTMVVMDNTLNAAAPNYAIQTIPLSGQAYVAPAITSPLAGSLLSGSSATFTWTPGQGILRYQLILGTTSAGSSDVYSGKATTKTSIAVSSIPTNGILLYAGLLYEVAPGNWQELDYTYTEAGKPTPPAMTSPVPSSVLSGAGITFTWDPGAGPQQFMLKVGTTHPGSQDVYNGAAIWDVSATVSKIPIYGVLLYARLYYSLDGNWSYVDYQYTEAGTPTLPKLMFPAPGSTLSGSGATFEWDPGKGPIRFMLKVGTTGAGSHDVYNGASTADDEVWISNIPTRGAPLYVRLYYEMDATWSYIDYTYTEQ